MKIWRKRSAGYTGSVKHQIISLRPNKGGRAKICFLMFNPFYGNVRNQHFGRATGEHFHRHGHGVENEKLTVPEDFY